MHWREVALVVFLIMFMTDGAAMKAKVVLGILGDLKHSKVVHPLWVKRGSKFEKSDVSFTLRSLTVNICYKN